MTIEDKTGQGNNYASGKNRQENEREKRREEKRREGEMYILLFAFRLQSLVVYSTR